MAVSHFLPGGTKPDCSSNSLKDNYRSNRAERAHFCWFHEVSHLKFKASFVLFVLFVQCDRQFLSYVDAMYTVDFKVNILENVLIDAELTTNPGMDRVRGRAAHAVKGI